MRFFAITLGTIMITLNACANVPKEKSDHFDGKHFFNLDNVNATKGFFSLLKWQLGGGKVSWPETIANTAKPHLPTEVKKGEAHITFINHASELIQLQAFNVLTDPLFSERASPVRWAGPKRVREPGLHPRELPKIDAVVVSHNHYDHMDLDSLKALYDTFKPRFFVPLGNKALLESVGIATGVTELDWWERYEFAEGRSITLVPAQHWSARGIFDRNEMLWGGYVIEGGGVKVYFAGDTGYGSFFKTIASRLGPIDISLLPIGAYEPRWFMKEQHMDPKEAVQAHFDLQSVMSIGMHFGCFALANEGPEDPAKALKRALWERMLPEDMFRAPDTGETVVFRKSPL